MESLCLLAWIGFLVGGTAVAFLLNEASNAALRPAPTKEWFDLPKGVDPVAWERSCREIARETGEDIEGRRIAEEHPNEVGGPGWIKYDRVTGRVLERAGKVRLT